MLSRVRSNLSYANVVSTLCLFILLGGSAYAAVKIGSKQIMDNSIKSRDVKNGSLAGKDFKAGSLPAGPQGPRGGQGPPGLAGAPATRLFGTVYGNGTLNYGSGVTSSSGSNGLYHVVFNRSLRGCAALAMVGVGLPRDRNVSNYTEGSRATTAIGVSAFLNDPNEERTVRVITTNNAGQTDAQSFQIAAFC